MRSYQLKKATSRTHSRKTPHTSKHQQQHHHHYRHHSTKNDTPVRDLYAAVAPCL